MLSDQQKCKCGCRCILPSVLQPAMWLVQACFACLSAHQAVKWHATRHSYPRWWASELLKANRSVCQLGVVSLSSYCLFVCSFLNDNLLSGTLPASWSKMKSLVVLCVMQLLDLCDHSDQSLHPVYAHSPQWLFACRRHHPQMLISSCCYAGCQDMVSLYIICSVSMVVCWHLYTAAGAFPTTSSQVLCHLPGASSAT